MDSDNILNQKSKIIIIALVLLVIISLFFVFKTNLARQEELKRFTKIEAELRQDNEALTKKFSSAQQEKRAIEEKFNIVQKDLETVSRERDEFKQKYDIAIKEREELIDKMRRMSAGPVPAPGAAAAAAMGDDVYWANILKEKAGLEVQLRNLQEQLRAFKLRIDQIEKDKQDLALEVNNLNQGKADLERQVDYNTKLSSNLSSDLLRERKDKKAIAEALAKIKEENGFLRRNLQQTNTAKLNVQSQLQAIEAERDTLKNRVAELNQIMQDRMDDLIQIKKELELSHTQAEGQPGESKDVELPPIVVRSSKERERPLKLDAIYGQVLSINREHNFVIVDLGESSGIIPGQEYRIWQDNRDIASVVVIQTRKDISAAGIKAVKSGYQIKVGDLVK